MAQLDAPVSAAGGAAGHGESRGSKAACAGLGRMKQASLVAWPRPAGAVTTRATEGMPAWWTRDVKRPEARCQRFNRVRSDVTQKLDAIETEKKILIGTYR